MKNNHSYYVGYTEDQFVENDYFQQWIFYAESDTVDFWDNYLLMNPQQLQLIQRAKNRVVALNNKNKVQSLSIEEKLVLKKNIFHHINQPFRSFTLMQYKSYQLLKVAAILSGIVMLTAYFLNKKPSIATTAALLVHRTGVKEIKEILLADSSVVILNANSSITYNSTIGNNQNREIKLEGNAFFKIKKKTDHLPFTVHTNSISIAVLGTEFNVDARSKATAIVLITGKVKVSADNNNSTAVYMSPGEKVQLDTLHNAFIKSTTNTLLYSAWTEGKWNFSSTSLLDITNLINEYYGVETVFANKKIERLKISAVIPVTDLDSFTNILSKTLNIKITEQHNQLHI